MHQYRVKSGSGSTRKARNVRQQAEDEDEDAAQQASRSKRKMKAPKGRGRGGRNNVDEDDDDAVEQEPLMDDEVTRSQEGVAEGERRAYAHRDIKPGEKKPPTTQPLFH